MKRHGYVSLFVFALMAGAQDQQVAHISGRLHSPEPFLQGYTVELDGLTPQHCRAPQADVHVDGEFSLRNVPFGDYLLRVSDIAGNIVAQQLVGVHDHESPIDIRLPPRPQLPTGATVSVAQLLHPPARKAILAAATAQRFAEEGRTDRAASELEKALKLSPDYAAARSNLAVQYIRLRRFDDARAEIERALAIAGPNPIDYANLAFAYAGLQRLGDAADAARRALQLDRNSAPAHYLLGSILALTPSTRSEGLAHLEAAADKLPSARRETEKYAP